jgi:hypothetical protein
VKFFIEVCTGTEEEPGEALAHFPLDAKDAGDARRAGAAVFRAGTPAEKMPEHFWVKATALKE